MLNNFHTKVVLLTDLKKGCFKEILKLALLQFSIIKYISKYGAFALPEKQYNISGHKIPFLEGRFLS